MLYRMYLSAYKKDFFSVFNSLHNQMFSIPVKNSILSFNHTFIGKNINNVLIFLNFGLNLRFQWLMSDHMLPYNKREHTNSFFVNVTPGTEVFFSLTLNSYV
jgi:hypothetical protein